MRRIYRRGASLAWLGVLHVLLSACGSSDVNSDSDSDSASTPSIDPVSISLQVEPKTIVAGESALLSWTVTGSAQRQTLSPGIGDVEKSGRLSVSPLNSTRYILDVIDGEGAQVSAQVFLSVGDGSGSWEDAVATRSYAAVETWYAAHTGHEALGLSEADLVPGSLESEYDGQVIEGVIGSYIKIKHNNVTVRGCRVVGSDGQDSGTTTIPRSGSTLTGIVIEYCTFEGPGGNPEQQTRAIQMSGPSANAVVVRHNNVFGWTSGIGSHGGTNAEYNWIHDLADPSASGAHRTSMRATGGDVAFYRNYATSGGSSAVSLYFDVQPMYNILIGENILNGSDPGASISYLINMKDGPEGPGATDIKILGNMFGDEYQYGIYSDANVPWGSNGNERCGNEMFLDGTSVIDTCPAGQGAASWREAWDSNDQSVLDAWYDDHTGPAALGIAADDLWQTGRLTITPSWLSANQGSHVFQDGNRWVVYAVSVPSIEIQADNVTIRGSLITMSGGVSGITGSGNNAMIEYCEITSDGTSTGMKAIENISGYTARYNEIHGLPHTAVRVPDNSLAEYNYIHSGIAGIKHVSLAIRGSNVRVRRNNVQTNQGSSTLGIYSHDALAPATGLSNILVEENLINGRDGHYGMMAGGEWNSQTQQATGIVVINNKFGVRFNECSGWTGSNYLWLGRADPGQCEDDRGNRWTGNRWLTTGNYIGPVTGHGATCPADVYNDSCTP